MAARRDLSTKVCLVVPKDKAQVSSGRYITSTKSATRVNNQYSVIRVSD